ncbi:hypothetical protein K7W42_17035 [Deinococcus sp. HMF7604]|uniref:hypothetical protein n=1 Tax=Deinococcus betulae TaxID=2873312 RepID=UPI001CCF5460|nr:hypothetical protein [Deinococcus betulae]MBZ9752556.1 hypothetical protein [Deinococcus betulae]
MKKIASVLLLPLLLAACGTSSAPQSADHSLLRGAPVAAGQNYVQAFEAKVQSDLKALGLDSDLSAQAVAPKSYLNVLRMSDSTARAYIKTTYPAETGCTVNWGDSSVEGATTPTPTNVSSQQLSHTYGQSGTYAIKLSCGADVKTMNFVATVQSNMDLFDAYPYQNVYQCCGFEYTYMGNSNYQEGGLKFSSPYLYIMQSGGGLPNGHKALFMYHYNGAETNFSAANGSVFDLNSITANTLFEGGSKLTAYDANNNVVGTTTFTNMAQYQSPVETRTLNWKNVKYVKVSTVVDYYSDYLNIDDMSVTIKQ